MLSNITLQPIKNIFLLRGKTREMQHSSEIWQGWLAQEIMPLCRWWPSPTARAGWAGPLQQGHCSFTVLVTLLNGNFVRQSLFCDLGFKFFSFIYSSCYSLFLLSYLFKHRVMGTCFHKNRESWYNGLLLFMPGFKLFPYI